MTEKIEKEIEVKAKQTTSELIAFMKELETEENKQIKELELDIEFYKSEIEKLKCCGNCIHCKYDENEESYEYCEKHQQVVNIAIVPCLEWKGR
jgi:hypothetical protein